MAFFVYNECMSGERLNTSPDTSEEELDAEQTEAKELANHRRGHRILEIFKGAFSKKEKMHSANYLLSENVEEFGHNRRDRKWWADVCELWDECGVDIPYDLGKMVEGIVKDPNYVFGVHHSNAVDGENYQNDVILRSIMENGLINMGDVSSGRVYKNPPVSKTVSMCPNMLWAVMQMKGQYKNSTGAVLVVLPSQYVDETGEIAPGMEDRVYYTNEVGNSVLRPEYILGFVQNLGKGSTCKFESRQDLMKNYK